MRASGDLFDSLTKRADGNNIVEAGDYWLVVGSSLPYAKKEVRRNPLTTTRQMRSRTGTILTAWILGGRG